MRSWVYKPTTPGSNLERDLARQRALQPAELMNFPPECAIRWSTAPASRTEPARPAAPATPAAPPREFIARVRSEDCAYSSEAFRQTIRPAMTYVLSAERFGIQDILYGENGKALFPSSGISYAARTSPPPGTSAAIVEAARASEWRTLDPARSLYLELAAARVVFELAPDFAPRHIENLRRLVASRYFDGLTIDRVQDNFVAQWGDARDTPQRELPDAKRRIEPEFDRALDPKQVFTVLPDPDGFAPRVGFIDGFAVGADPKSARVWLAHCYGVLGVGRDEAVDSGSGAELYAVIGHAPRQLDRNIALIGRAVAGIEHLAALPRGTAAMGLYAQASERVPIRRMRFGDELAPSERLELEILRTDSESFTRLIETRRDRRDSWYKRPAGYVDLCNVSVPSRPRAVSAAVRTAAQ